MSEKIVINVAGWRSCTFFQRAATVVSALQYVFPDTVVAAIHEYDDKAAYLEWLLPEREKFGAKAATHKSSPFSWVNKDQFIGGCDDTLAYVKDSYYGGPKKQALTAQIPAVEEGAYDYDVVVIGGGSGGLACSKELAIQGLKVAVLDYVKPSPSGTTWGLGGTCVNVGCIPKKLMHTASLLGEKVHKDCGAFGWVLENKGHDWSKMVDNIQDHIHGLNFNYRVELRDKNVTYLNMLGTFKDAHTLECTNPRKPTQTITAKRFVVAVGGRPKPLDCPGGELAISSDDIFSMQKSPGKTLVIGASYVALECAGFMAGIGLDVTVMVRSILLRGFDTQCADMIGEFMQKEGCKFIRGSVPSKLEKGADGRITCFWESNGETKTDVYDTVLVAIGRDADVSLLGLEALGVEQDKWSKKIVAPNEQTSVQNIYAIGDVVQDCPELTPVAIQAGKMLAKRIAGVSDQAMDYSKVCTAVFTPLEYGTCGLSEEEATKKHGANLEVYHASYTPLEWALSDDREANSCYCKLLVNKADNNAVVGMHMLGPDCGEITQGFGLAMKLNASYEDFCECVGIHPTVAEQFTTLSVSKSSGEAADAGGC